EDIAGTPAGPTRRPVAPMPPPTPDPSTVRPILSRAVGVMREAAGLRQAVHALLPLASSESAGSDLALVGLMIAVAALRREESRGAHHRTDFPHHAPAPCRSSLRLDEALAAAHDLDSPSLPIARRA